MSTEFDLLFGDSHDLAKLQELMRNPRKEERIAPAPKFKPHSLWLFTTKVRCLHCGQLQESLKYFEVMLRSTIPGTNRSMFEAVEDLSNDILKLPRYIKEEEETTTRMCQKCFENLPLPEQLPLPLPGPACAFRRLN